MGLFEWWGERIDPGPVGGVDLVGPRPVPRSMGLVFARFTLSLTSLVAVAVAAMVVPETTSVDIVLKATSAYATYVVIATLFRPRPDTSNLGLMGGFIDHPFRYSDDLNRGLLTLGILLWPGRIIGEGVVDVFHVIAAGDDA